MVIMLETIQGEQKVEIKQWDFIINIFYLKSLMLDAVLNQ